LVMATLAFGVYSQTRTEDGHGTAAELKTAADAASEASGKKVPSFSLPTLPPFREEWGNSIDY
jgi:hypothetical protein